MLMVKTILITRYEVTVIIAALKSIEIEIGLSHAEQGLLERMEQLFEEMSRLDDIKDQMEWTEENGIDQI